MFNVWVEPVAEVTVKQETSGLFLEATNCRVRGSEMVENLRLDERFCMRFVTQLTWQSGDVAAGRVPAALADSGESSTAPAAASEGRISANADLQVRCENVF